MNSVGPEIRNRLRSVRSAKTFEVTFALFFLALIGAVSHVEVSLACQTDKPFPGELAGLDQSESMLIDDSRPLAANRAFLNRLLYRARKSSSESFDKYLAYSEGVALADIVRTPRQYRGWVFRVSGTAVRASRMKGLADSGIDEEEFVAVDLETKDGQVVRVFAAHAPREWLNGGEFKERAEFVGFFALHSGLSVDVEPTLIFAANRVAWFPDADSRLVRKINGHLELAQTNFDLGLLDICRDQNLKPLNEMDSKAFYSMLTAAGKVKAVQQPILPGSFFGLIRNPTEQVGQFVEVEVAVRRVVPVSVDKSQLAQGSFFQLDGFYRLRDTPIEVQGLDGKKTTYHSRFPVTINAVDLPGNPREYEQKNVRVRGFFYRFWSYDSDLVPADGKSSGQVAPLIIATEVIVLDDADASIAGQLALIVLAAGGFAVGAVWWISRRAGKPKRDRISLPDKIQVS